jgi:bifunctional non-homologous end joining protein LigD
MAKRSSPYQPQLALLVKTPPTGEQWVHELKLDGYRIGAIVDGASVKLITRNQNDWTAQFPQIVTAVKTLKLKDAILDGELCAVLPDGRTSFHAMQHFRGGKARLVYFVFDALRLAGRDLIARPLLERKAALAKAVGEKNPQILYVDHVEGDGDVVLREACRVGAEGIVSKLRDASYDLGGRRGGWQKSKCTLRQEFVIGGFTEPTNKARSDIGALLVGYYDGDALVFAGKVGTGWDRAMSRELRAKLDPIEQREMPFVQNEPDRPLQRVSRWVRPRLVAEVQFSEWTPDGHIRHPSFQGLRLDKGARDVKNESR